LISDRPLNKHLYKLLSHYYDATEEELLPKIDVNEIQTGIKDTIIYQIMPKIEEER
jgi:hypothetical protein